MVTAGHSDEHLLGRGTELLRHKNLQEIPTPNLGSVLLLVCYYHLIFKGVKGMQSFRQRIQR